MKKSNKDIIQILFVLTVLFLLIFIGITFQLIKALAYWKFLTQ
jgi:phage shock protein PspC (stress-responsive transcriptional regulator)